MNNHKSLFLKLKLGLLALFFGFSSMFAQAENVAALVYETKNIKVTLFSTACKNKVVLEMIRDDMKKNFRAAQVVWQGKMLEACWTILNSEVVLGDETGDTGTIPLGAFHRVDKM